MIVKIRCRSRGLFLFGSFKSFAFFWSVLFQEIRWKVWRWFLESIFAYCIRLRFKWRFLFKKSWSCLCLPASGQTGIHFSVYYVEQYLFLCDWFFFLDLFLQFLLNLLDRLLLDRISLRFLHKFLFFPQIMTHAPIRSFQITIIVDFNIEYLSIFWL